jgi:hypothetical protein
LGFVTWAEAAGITVETCIERIARDDQSNVNA